MSLLVLINPWLTCFHGEIPQLPQVKPKAFKSVFAHDHVIVCLLCLISVHLADLSSFVDF